MFFLKKLFVVSKFDKISKTIRAKLKRFEIIYFYKKDYL